MLKMGESMRDKTFWYFSLFVGSALQNAWYGQIPIENCNLPQKWNQASSLIFDQSSEKVILKWDKLLDLWGLGKGYLIELIAKVFEQYKINFFCINGGGDILIKQDNFGQLWEIILQNPRNSKESIGKVRLKNGACCGSGTTYRSRIKNHQRMHHLIDPYTQKPAKSQLLAVYVIHEDIRIADMLATTFFVAPIEKIDNIAKQFNAEFFIIFDDMSSILSKWFPFIP